MSKCTCWSEPLLLKTKRFSRFLFYYLFSYLLKPTISHLIKSFPTSVVCLYFFANSLDPDQIWENVRLDLDPNFLTLWWCSWKSFSNVLILKIKVKTAASFCNPVNITLARSDCKLVFFRHEFSLYLKNFKAIILCQIFHSGHKIMVILSWMDLFLDSGDNKSITIVQFDSKLTVEYCWCLAVIRSSTVKLFAQGGLLL